MMVRRLESCFFCLYLPVNPAGVHPSGEGLDGDNSLSHSQIGPSISHHTILFLTDEGSSSETQEISISEEKKKTSVVRGKEWQGSGFSLTPGLKKYTYMHFIQTTECVIVNIHQLNITDNSGLHLQSQKHSMYVLFSSIRTQNLY